MCCNKMNRFDNYLSYDLYYILRTQYIFPFQLMSRRSFSSMPASLVDQPKTKISPWCSVALLCHRTYSPVCGYDDNFGYGKFDDICHMLQVNCYWKYSKWHFKIKYKLPYYCFVIFILLLFVSDFALVPSCRPVI